MPKRLPVFILPLTAAGTFPFLCPTPTTENEKVSPGYTARYTFDTLQSGWSLLQWHM